MKFDRLVNDYMKKIVTEEAAQAPAQAPTPEVVQEAEESFKYLKTQKGDFVCAGKCWETYSKATGKGLTDGQPKDLIKDYEEVNSKHKSMPKDYKCKICGIMPASDVNPVTKPLKEETKYDVDGFKALCFEIEGGDKVCAGDCFKKYADSKGEATAGKPEDTLEMYKKINAKFKCFPKGFKCGICGHQPEKIDLTAKKS